MSVGGELSILVVFGICCRWYGVVCLVGICLLGDFVVVVGVNGGFFV